MVHWFGRLPYPLIRWDIGCVTYLMILFLRLLMVSLHRCSRVSTPYTQEALKLQMPGACCPALIKTPDQQTWWETACSALWKWPMLGPHWLPDVNSLFFFQNSLSKTIWHDLWCVGLVRALPGKQADLTCWHWLTHTPCPGLHWGLKSN